MLLNILEWDVCFFCFSFFWAWEWGVVLKKWVLRLYKFSYKQSPLHKARTHYVCLIYLFIKKAMSVQAL
jgi:hypothetical protein